MAAVAVAAIAGTEGPDRLFALNVASNLIASSLFFVFLPHLTAGGGVRSVECALSICAVCFGSASRGSRVAHLLLCVTVMSRGHKYSSLKIGFRDSWLSAALWRS